MFTIHRSIDIDFAHHVRGHDGACINVHGHTWKFEVGMAAEQLDGSGFVVDFSQLSRAVLRPCHALLDHSLAVGEATFAETETALAALGKPLLASRSTPQSPGEPFALGGARAAFPGGMKVAVFPFAPTSERLAQWLYELAAGCLADERVQVAYARIYETLHPVVSLAEYRPGPVRFTGGPSSSS